jgi:hypothetical protein
MWNLYPFTAARRAASNLVRAAHGSLGSFAQGINLVRNKLDRRQHCLTCAFCTRNRNKYYNFPLHPELSKWALRQNSLTSQERETLSRGDDSFIGQEIRAAELWDTQFAQAEAKADEEERRKHKGTMFEHNLPSRWMANVTGMGTSKENERAKKYGMTKRPDAPDEDYLSCFQQQWSEKRNRKKRRIDRTFYRQPDASFITTSRRRMGNTRSIGDQ